MEEDNKYYVNTLIEVGDQGPGVYVVTLGPDKRKVITVTDQNKMVEQSQREQTEISTLLEPAIKAGLLRHAVKYEGEYDDITQITYLDALNTVAKGKSMFEALPSNIKDQFDNKPDKFLGFVQDPKNVQQLIDWGVLKGNDGKTATGTPSGAPAPGDLDGDGLPDTPPPTPSTTPV